MFQSILTSAATTAGLTMGEAAICTGASVVLGLIIALIYIAQGEHSKNFVVTLALLPTLVQVVMMMVNGNLGTGIAVMGAFSLVRFRSVPGSSKEIISIFFAMAIGLATGMGYITFAAAMTVIIGAVLFILSKTSFGANSTKDKDLRITIPESLNFTDAFDDVFEKYTVSHELVRVKTTNMGSMYDLTYRIKLKDDNRAKEMFDEIRCRNGNLTIICSQSAPVHDEL